MDMGEILMAINIPKLLPIVRKEFPTVPLPKLLKVMSDFSKKHKDITDEQAIASFQTAMQKMKQPQPRFQGLMGQLPTGVR